jgi:hypothetical protein
MHARVPSQVSPMKAAEDTKGIGEDTMLEGQELGVGDIFEIIPPFRTEFLCIWIPKFSVHVDH